MNAGLDPDRAGAPAVLLLDVGQGDATLIVLPGVPRRGIVVDCNDDAVVCRHLADFGVERLIVAFTHLDLDHIRGGLALVQEWRDRLDAVWVDTDGRALDGTDDTYATAKQLLDALTTMKEGGATFRLNPPSAGLALADGAGWSVSFLAPLHQQAIVEARGGPKRSPNHRSAIVRIVRETPEGSRSVLIGGDAPLGVWKDVESPASNVFRTPHHGGALDEGGAPPGWSSAALYEAIQPADVVVSVGSTNRHGHPHPDWQPPPTCLVRCTQVTQRCHPHNPSDSARLRENVLAMRGRAEPAWRHLTVRGSPRRGSDHLEVPCAGTVTVGLPATGPDVRPNPADHAQVVSTWATPWCVAPKPEEEEDPILELLKRLGG